MRWKLSDGEWRRWFAWRPVAVGTHAVWLEWLEVRCTNVERHPEADAKFEYRGASQHTHTTKLDAGTEDWK